AKTVLYMTWARRNAPESQQAITDAYTVIGRELGAMVVPAAPEPGPLRASVPSTCARKPKGPARVGQTEVRTVPLFKNDSHYRELSRLARPAFVTPQTRRPFIPPRAFPPAPGTSTPRRRSRPGYAPGGSGSSPLHRLSSRATRLGPNSPIRH